MLQYQAPFFFFMLLAAAAASTEATAQPPDQQLALELTPGDLSATQMIQTST